MNDIKAPELTTEENTKFTAAMTFNSDKEIIQEVRKELGLGEKETMRVILAVALSAPKKLADTAERFAKAIEAEDQEQKAAREAEKAQLKAEKDAERQRIKAENAAARAKAKAEKEAEKARQKAEELRQKAEEAQKAADSQPAEDSVEEPAEVAA